MKHNMVAARKIARVSLLLFWGVQFRVGRDMPGQSGASEIKTGNNWINRGKRCDHAPQAMKDTAEHAKRGAMKTVSLMTVAILLGFGATALVAAEQPATGPSGFSAATESANSKGKTGESAECPIKKTVDGKTFCFQNDPALTKPQGGH
ncbi:MAG: hypothetical protein WAM06_07170 [Methyloceanibacter sp.]